MQEQDSPLPTASFIVLKISNPSSQPYIHLFSKIWDIFQQMPHDKIQTIKNKVLHTHKQQFDQIVLEKDGMSIQNSLLEISTSVDNGQWLNLFECSTQVTKSAWNSIYQCMAAGLLIRKEPNLITNIQNIKFPVLSRMILAFNRIESIEGLCRIHMPLIQQIDVCQNCLVNVQKLFRKSYFPNLRQIDARYNKIVQYGNGPNGRNLSELFSPYLKCLYIASGKSAKNAEKNYDNRWICKVQTNELAFISIPEEIQHLTILMQSLEKKDQLRNKKTIFQKNILRLLSTTLDLLILVQKFLNCFISNQLQKNKEYFSMVSSVKQAIFKKNYPFLNFFSSRFLKQCIVFVVTKSLQNLCFQFHYLTNDSQSSIFQRFLQLF